MVRRTKRVFFLNESVRAGTVRVLQDCALVLIASIQFVMTYIFLGRPFLQLTQLLFIFNHQLADHFGKAQGVSPHTHSPLDVGVTVSFFSNSGLSGIPFDVKVVPDTSEIVAAGNDTLSVSISGTVTFPSSGLWRFDCKFKHTAVAFFWVDGHLLCQDGNVYNATVDTTDNPLPIRSRRSFALRAHLYKNLRSSEPISMAVRWAHQDTPNEPRSQMLPIPSSALDPVLSVNERRRDALQASAAKGWGNMLHHSMLTFTRLPAGIALTPTVCQLSTQRCIEFCVPDGLWKSDSGCEARVGPYALDRSFGQFFFGGNPKDNRSFVDANISVSFVAGKLDSSLKLLVEPVVGGCGSGDDCSDFVLRINSRFLWNRSGTVTVTRAPTGGSIVFAPSGLPASHVFVSSPFLDDEATRVLPRSALGGMDDVFVALHRGGAVSLSVNAADTVASVSVVVEAAKQTYTASMLAKFGTPDLAEVAIAVEAAVAWTAISTPVENNAVLMPVSRGWSRVAAPPKGVSAAAATDWTYAIFDWDNLFASLLAASTSKEVAYSNVIQSFKAKTAEGYLPNCAGGGYRDQDRTEPLVGARVVLDLFRKFNDKWLVELVFDDMLDWVEWTQRSRTDVSMGLYTLRSFNERTGKPGGMQEARYESGLDNSPMYDCKGDQQDGCEYWNKATGTMELFDVGMSSMAASELFALAELAEAIGRTAEADGLRARGETFGIAIRSRLWDERMGTYANLVRYNQSLSKRISPTSFYPFLLGTSGLSDDTRALAMVNGWLTNETRFCIGNRSDRCFWGLPSIAADDASFPALGYWRGFVWGPMAQLTWWSLQEFDHLPSVRAARKALAAQMSEMFVNMWRLHRHVCENYLPHKNGTEVDGKVWPNTCTGTTFYHWGALAGLIQLEESGKFYERQMHGSTQHGIHRAEIVV
eukprot:TRINITY_DN4941_c0_g1_i1.p1 TRINITY_DN4941_c0_g1~~TRINITY_DN4941_c0_g1_i1.p1  ORF type:complete len:926 (+),score=102.55 TRINITY_DN4941_c0_g1_i1:35-2812(+)